MANYTTVTEIKGNSTNDYYFFFEDDCLYLVYQKRGENMYLHCMVPQCPRRGVINNETFRLTNSSMHSHDDDHVDIMESKIALNHLRNSVIESFSAIRDLHLQALRQVSPEAAGLMAWSTVKRSLQRVRHDQMPFCNSLEMLEAHLESNDRVRKTYGELRGEPFYYGAVKGQLFFVNYEILNAIRPGCELFVDATFGIVPFRAEQLLVMLAEILGRPRPIIYVVMTSRLQKMYETVFQFVRDAIFVVNGIEITPTSIMMDFEKSIRNAVDKVWPGIRKLGCNFHMDQCLRRKASSLQSLSTKIHGPTRHHHILKMYMRISMLPVEHVEQGLKSLEEHIRSSGLSQDFKAFNKYFRDTWFQRYRKTEWNVSDLHRRTNNNLEGYNKFIKQIIHYNPSPWCFLDGLIDLAIDASAELYSDRRRNSQPPPDRSIYTEPLKNALSLLQSHQINEFDFLDQMASVQSNSDNDQ